MGDFLLSIRVALGSACLLLDLGTGKLFLGCAPQSLLPSPVPSNPPFPPVPIPAAQAGKLHPQDVYFHSCASYFLFAPKSISPGRSSSHRMIPWSSSSAHVDPEGTKMLPLASPSAQNSCCQSTRLHQKNHLCDLSATKSQSQP